MRRGKGRQESPRGESPTPTRKHNPHFSGNQTPAEFSVTETVGGAGKSKGQMKREKKILVEKAYLGTVKCHNDGIFRKNVYIGGTLFTQPHNEKVIIGKDCPDLQSVFNSFAGQHAQARWIQLPPGAHKGCFRIDRGSSTVSIEGSTLGLRIVGDTRYIAGMAFVHGLPLTYRSVDKDSKLYPLIGNEDAEVELSCEGNKLKITCGSAPDFTKLGVNSSDLVLIRDE